jgi:hypothetical protein
MSCLWLLGALICLYFAWWVWETERSRRWYEDLKKKNLDE